MLYSEGGDDCILEKNKKLLFILIIITIISIFFVSFIYKKFHSGNNRYYESANEVLNHIIEMKSYTATIEVTIKSNKNTNKYVLKQDFSKEASCKQTVMEPENIAGIELEYNNNSLAIKNSRFNISKIYNNYPYISDNVLWLSSFAELCRNNPEKVETSEKNNEVIIEINSENNRYLTKRKLYLEKQSGKPLRMEIVDNNKNTTVYISYKEISIN